MTVGLAFDFFAKEAVDIAVIEVGMGGRLDSTNVITPLHFDKIHQCPTLLAPFIGNRINDVFIESDVKTDWSISLNFRHTLFSFAFSVAKIFFFTLNALFSK